MHTTGHLRRARHTALLPLVLCAALTPALALAQTSRTLRAEKIAQPFDRAWGKLVTGRLANGVRFAILPRKGSEPGLGLLMRNDGGFIAERRPGEHGLAHLIEHIVFHSPTAAAPDDLNHLPRLGVPLTLPAPDAASTSWRESNYYLSTRTNAPADLDTLLGLFAEAASGMTLRADAVDASRGEVMREMADKKLGNEIYADFIAAVAPGSPNDVLDAQNSDDVPTAGIDTIRSLYQRLYRPEQTMIVVVGDVNPAEVKALIEKRFGTGMAHGPATRAATFPTFQRERIRPISFSTRTDGRRSALMTVVMPTPAPPASRNAQAQAELMDLLVTRAVSDRLTAAQPGSPKGKTGMSIDNGEQGQRQILIWDHFTADPWQPAVASLRKVTCELAIAGFTEAEWTAARRNLLADLEQRAAAMATVPNVELAKDLSHALADGRHLIPADELLHYARAHLARIDARSASRSWRAEWRSGVEHLRVETPDFAKVVDPISAIRVAANGAVSTAACKVS